LLTFIKIIYRFGEPDVIKKIDELTDKLSNDPMEQFFQMIESAEKYLLKPFVPTIENEIEKTKKNIHITRQIHPDV